MLDPGERPAVDVRAVERAAADALDDWVSDLREIVAIDSGSYSPGGVNAVLDVVERWLRDDGWSVERHPRLRSPDGAEFGDALVGSVAGSGKSQVLLVGHADTVFAEGTTAERPLRVEEGKAFGPGVCDMKGGLLLGLAAVRWLRRLRCDAFGRISFLITPDEEVGSHASRPLILDLAARHDVAFVLEAARENGSIVSARKGLTTAEVKLFGRAAHAGVEPERGRNALLAAAHLLIALQGLNGISPGATVNVGVLRGGTRSNVIADRAELEVEIRAVTARDLDAIEAEVRRLAATPWIDGVEAGLRIAREHHPMERSREITALVELTAGVAAELGIGLGDEATGGASDANEIASIDVPVLDGLGPVGGDDHSDREWIDLHSLPVRIALLAGILARVGPRA
jgi:glutamate carboxypeptidase